MELSMAESFRGYIDRITYHNPENGYTIARLVAEGQREKITVVGAIASLEEGRMSRLKASGLTTLNTAVSLE